jgi:uridine kinase
MDFRIYVDITPETKFNWKVQRDHEERGHSIESIKQSIEARKPDFDAYIDPQKKKADVIIQVPPERDNPPPPQKNYAAVPRHQGESQEASLYLLY